MKYTVQFHNYDFESVCQLKVVLYVFICELSHASLTYSRHCPFLSLPELQLTCPDLSRTPARKRKLYEERKYLQILTQAWREREKKRERETLLK